MKTDVHHSDDHRSDCDDHLMDHLMDQNKWPALYCIKAN